MKGLLLALDRRRRRRAEEEASGSEALPASAPRTAGLGGTPERWIGGAATAAARMGEADVGGGGSVEGLEGSVVVVGSWAGAVHGAREGGSDRRR
jgi:hypothetical protein